MKNYSCFFVCLVDALTLTPFNLVPNVPLGPEANALPIRDWERDEKNAFVLYVPTYFVSMTIDDSFKPSDFASNVMRPAFSVD